MTLIREPILGGGGTPSHSVLSTQRQTTGNSLTFSVPGGTLSDDGDMLVLTATGLMSGAPLGNLQISWGGSLIYNQLYSTTFVNWGAEAKIVRTGAAQQRCWTKGGDLAHTEPGGATRTANLAAAQSLLVTILGGGTAGIVYTYNLELVKAA
jgi:hypothetical protein